MALPRAVQEQADLADQMVAQIQGVPPAKTDDTPPADPQPQDPPADIPQQEVKPDVLPELPEVSEETWKQRFVTMQGKYHAEVPRYAEQIRELTNTVNVLLTENNALREQITQRVDEKPASPVTDSEREAFGSDLVDLQERIAKSVAEPLMREIETLKAKNKELEGRVGTVDKQASVTAQEAFFTRLGSVVPDWEVLDTDPRFLAWLDEIDVVYGVPRRTALQAAHGALDVARVAAIFNAFKQSLPAPKPSPKQDLSSQVAPTRSRTAQVATDGHSEKVWTDADITRFYSDVRTGALTEEDASRIEQEMQLALNEGRYRPR